MELSELQAALAAPFPRSEVLGRIGTKTKDGKKAQVLAYVDARTVMKRLDDVLGIGGWMDEIRPIADGKGFICRLGLRMPDGTWVYREDVADLSQVEALKGGASDAFKRAAVKFGVGRYLYDLDSPWVDLDARGFLPKNFVFPLPNWALLEQDRLALSQPTKSADPDEVPWGNNVHPLPSTGSDLL
jgi:hypothetical protein